MTNISPEEEMKKAIYSIKNKFKNGDDISISLIQRKCCFGFLASSRAFQELTNQGFIIERMGSIGKFKI